MATSFEDILNRMRNAPHNGIPPVTNPKVPTKVERDAAAFAERVKNNPIIPTSTGSQLDEILKRMRDSSHGGMVYADPAFNGNADAFANMDAFDDDEYNAFIAQLMEKKKLKSNAEFKDDTTNDVIV